MKEEALALADELEHGVWYKNPYTEDKMDEASAMIRRLVEELDKAEERNLKIVRKNEHLLGEFFKVKEELACALDYIKQYQVEIKPLSDDEIISIRDSCYVQSGIDEWEFDDLVFARAIEERHGIK